jgi:hypothetical protein
MADLDRLTAALAGRYAIERELGAGGMATVYLARDVKHNRQVAVKVLRPELAAALGAERFLHEIRVAAQLNHPHILPLFDSGQAFVPPHRGAEGGTGGEAFLYYVMPVVEGESLRDRLSRERQLPIAHAVRLTEQIASALDYAHRQGVIHRDIKPENVLLHEGEAMVTDFGIALAISEAGGTRLTETGFSLGTPHYMSPEQAAGEQELDARSDVYALGCVLFEMLAGEPPFMGANAQSVIAKRITESPPSISTLRDTVPTRLKESLVKALARSPADRYESAAAFATAVAQEPTGAQVTTRWNHPVPARLGPAGRGWIADHRLADRYGYCAFGASADGRCEPGWAALAHLAPSRSRWRLGLYWPGGCYCELHGDAGAGHRARRDADGEGCPGSARPNPVGRLREPNCRLDTRRDDHRRPAHRSVAIARGAAGRASDGDRGARAYGG